MCLCIRYLLYLDKLYYPQILLSCCCERCLEWQGTGEKTWNQKFYTKPWRWLEGRAFVLMIVPLPKPAWNVSLGIALSMSLRAMTENQPHNLVVQLSFLNHPMRCNLHAVKCIFSIVQSSEVLTGIYSCNGHQREDAEHIHQRRKLTCPFCSLFSGSHGQLCITAVQLRPC